MERVDILNGLILRDLDVLSKDSLEDRVILQKKVYLLQELDIDIGYSYNWYLKGPYSPGLTNYVYDKLDYLIARVQELDGYNLKDNVIRKIKQINSLDKCMASGLNTASWYELLASIRYIYKNPYLWEIKDPSIDDIIRIVRAEKPHFTGEQCHQAMELLQNNGLIEARGG